MVIFKNKPVPPEVINEHGQITDKKLLRPERYKFGFANIMFQGEEVGLGPIHTVIIRALGGSALHLGVAGAMGGIGSVFQWLGTMLLKKFNSNKKAMVTALSFGVVLAALITGFILLAMNPAFKFTSLWAYLILGLLLAAATGVQWNIETSWIGDLVPKNILGWFTSVKWMVAVFGILCFMMIFGKLADLSPTLPTYAFIFGIVAASHVIAIILMGRITDRVPKNANFVDQGATHHDRLNYRALPLWTYIFFYLLWSGGRTAMFAFTTAYMLDYFHYSVTKIAALGAIQSVISILFLFVMGKVTDKRGNRIPLMLVSGCVGLCMLLWVGSAWWGIAPIIAYSILNGAAGHSHSMLAINYGLEIFPDKGRSGYLAFSRFFIGGTSMVTAIVAGFFLRGIEGWEMTLWGAKLVHYHLFFIICTSITLCCTLPLMIAGKRTVRES